VSSVVRSCGLEASSLGYALWHWFCMQPLGCTLRRWALSILGSALPCAFRPWAHRFCLQLSNLNVVVNPLPPLYSALCRWTVPSVVGPSPRWALSSTAHFVVGLVEHTLLSNSIIVIKTFRCRQIWVIYIEPASSSLSNLCHHYRICVSIIDECVPSSAS